MVDLIAMKAYLFHDETLGAKYDIEDIPADLLDQCKKMRMELLEEIATIDESNEDFMTKVLENPDSITEDEIHAVIRLGVITNKFNPVLCGICLQKQRRSANSRLRHALDALSSGPRHDPRPQNGFGRNGGDRSIG